MTTRLQRKGLRVQMVLPLIGWLAFVFTLTALIDQVDLAYWLSLRGRVPGYRLVEPVHIAAHTLVFAVMASLLAGLLRRNLSLSAPILVALVLLTVLEVGLVQEMAQGLLRGYMDPAASSFDVAVDLFGGVLGVGWMLKVGKQKATDPEIDGWRGDDRI